MLTLQSLPMSDSLLQAYLPLLVWPSVGLLLFKILPDDFPRRLGRFLYWVGIPLEIFCPGPSNRLFSKHWPGPVILRLLLW